MKQSESSSYIPASAHGTGGFFVSTNQNLLLISAVKSRSIMITISIIYKDYRMTNNVIDCANWTPKRTPAKPRLRRIKGRRAATKVRSAKPRELDVAPAVASLAFAIGCVVAAWLLS